MAPKLPPEYLTPEEHSRLLYLLDALRCVTDKSSRKVIQLLQVVFPTPESSRRYKASWDRLSQAFWEERLAVECLALRNELR